MRSNLARYSLWQARDFLRERGFALLLVGFLIGFTVVGPVKAMGRPIDAQLGKSLLNAVVSQVAFILAFIALNGIVSTDRKNGYYRFLFSKPVSIPAFYAQLFVIYFIGFVAMCAVLLGAFAVFAHPVPWVAPLMFCALVFASLGGISFLISSLFRYDWPILAAVFLGSILVHSLWRDREGWRRMLLSITPPLDRLPGTLSDMVNTGTVNTQDLLWLLGYSAICFAAGLFVLRRRPFA
jgi:ABC-type transport system involved in multi-copper enzyme maturation permease subunit